MGMLLQTCHISERVCSCHNLHCSCPHAGIYFIAVLLVLSSAAALLQTQFLANYSLRSTIHTAGRSCPPRVTEVQQHRQQSQALVIMSAAAEPLDNSKGTPPPTTARIIDGKAIAASIRSELATTVSAFKEKTGITPGLAVVLVGEECFWAAGIRHTAR